MVLTDDDLASVSEEALAFSEPRFRVMRAGSASQALKLEAIWWDGLEAMARARRVPLSTLVFQLLSRLPENNNKSAYLRLCAAVYLMNERRRFEARPDASLLALVREAPAPALIISEASGVVEINARALRELERRLLQYEMLSMAKVQIRQRALIDDLFADLRASGAVSDCDLKVRAGEGALTVQIRATLFPGAAMEGGGLADWACCFVLPPR
ncbi:MAG: ribbon-helix-helix domain-containing protein [Amphiplicatus sp.]